jgi:hypothetical protein
MAPPKTSKQRKAAAAEAAAKFAAAAETPNAKGPMYDADGNIVHHPFSESTIGDYGLQLPMGVVQGGEFHRGFGFKPYKMKQEKELAALRKKSTNRQAGSMVVTALSHMLTHFGPYAEWEKMSEDHRALALHQAYMGDIMYAYIWLRIEAMGPELKFDHTCPACDRKSKLPVDLRQGDVKIAERPEHLLRWCDLADGVTVQADKPPVKRVSCTPPRWLAMNQLSPDKNEGHLKEAIIASSVRVGEAQQPMTPALLDDLSKRDLEFLTKFIDDGSPGPDLTCTLVCSHCSHESVIPLQWSWDFFMTAASQ